MNNRGQIYIIAALILSAVIFLLVSQTNFVQRTLIEDDFEQISKNFDIESAKLMNSLLAEGEISDINETISEFKNFADKFSEYSRVENPDFEFIYILNYEGQNIFGNYMLEELDVGGMDILGVGTKPVGQNIAGVGYTTSVSQSVDSVDNVKPVSLLPEDIVIRGMRYDLKSIEGPQIVIISREEKDDQTKVYMSEEFVEGEKVS